LVAIFQTLLLEKLFPYEQVTHNILPSRERSYGSAPNSNFTVHFIFFNTLKHHVNASDLSKLNHQFLEEPTKMTTPVFHIMYFSETGKPNFAKTMYDTGHHL
jgi:hypothetical protein